MKPRRALADRVWAIVPVNVLCASKARLGPSLNTASRCRLSEAMLLDVLHALRNVRGISRIIVVSADASVRQLVRSSGVRFLSEGERRGLNKGVRLAVREALKRKASSVLILPSDVPLITPREIHRFLRLSDNYPITIAPSKDGRGTNALLLRPPDVIGPAFGRNSFQKHQLIAKRKGIPPRVIRSRSMAFDVDEPADLAHLRRLRLKNETGRLLKSLGAASEIKV